MKRNSFTPEIGHEGALQVYGINYHWYAKVYDEGSEYGIDGGRVSKLEIKQDGKTVVNFDRGWDIEPQDQNAQLAMEIILHEYN